MKPCRTALQVESVEVRVEGLGFLFEAFKLMGWRPGARRGGFAGWRDIKVCV